MNILFKWLKITNQFNKIDSEEKPSHLLLNGYVLYVKKENLELFNKKYTETLINKDYLYIVECRRKIFKLFFDLDFLIKDEEELQLHLQSNIFMDIIQIINDIIFDFYGKYYTCIITTADIKKVEKPCKNEEYPDKINKVEYIKKGFHLHFPDIDTNKQYALEIRKACITKLSETFKNKFSNSLNDILDEHVFTTSGLRLTGSRKGHFISQTKEFVDEGRPYKLFNVLTDNVVTEEIYKELNDDMYLLIKKTSIITDASFITNIVNNPNLDHNLDSNYENCENCEDSNEESSTWNRLAKDDIKYIEILRFFNTYVKDYSIKDIKRIFYSNNQNIYMLFSQSKLCSNMGRAHNSEHIYFKLNKDGICQKCFCRCDTMDGRKYGYCKDYSSTLIPCTPHLIKLLNFKEYKSDRNLLNKLDTESNMNSLFDNLRDSLYNQFTNKEKLPSKRRNNKK